MATLVAQFNRERSASVLVDEILDENLRQSQQKGLVRRTVVPENEADAASGSLPPLGMSGSIWLDRGLETLY